MVSTPDYTRMFRPTGNGQWYITTGTATATSAYADQVWNSWVVPSSTTITYQRDPVELAAERDRARQRAIADQRRYEEGQAERRRLAKEAQERAKQLLLSLLSEDERKRYRHRNGKIVITGSNGRLYEVSTDDYQGNVYELDGNHKRVAGYCCHPRMRDQKGRPLPVEDAWASQVLCIKVHVEDFLAVANVTWDERPMAVRHAEANLRARWRQEQMRANGAMAA